MSKKNKKKLREEAMRAEINRREAQRAENSSIDKQQMLSLIEFVGKSIMKNGHDDDFKYTEKWCSDNSVEIDAFKSFLETQKIKDDWSLMVDGDPFAMFGDSEIRLMWMPLD